MQSSVFCAYLESILIDEDTPDSIIFSCGKACRNPCDGSANDGLMALLQHQQALRSHVEQQVNDAQVGQETQFLLKYLIVGLWREVGVFQSEILFGVDAFAEVCLICGELGPVFGGAFQFGLYVEQGADEAAEFFVEVYQELISLLVEGAEVIFVVFKKGCMVVCRFDGVPVQVSPVAVVGDADVLHGAFQRVRLHGGDGECQFAVWCGDGAAVAVGLFHVVVVLLNEYFVVCQQLGIVLYGGQIGGGKVYGFHEVYLIVCSLTDSVYFAFSHILFHR